MISYDDALALLLKEAKGAVNVEFVELCQSLGRVLACDVRANENYPALPTAAMDGYACLASDIKTGAKLEIIGLTPAGLLPENSIKSGQCVKTFTGALMCENSDTLLPIENIEFSENSKNSSLENSENSNNYIIVKEPVKKGFALRQIGESYKKGEILVKAGTRIDYSVICVLSELGIASVCVFKKPKVAILATGSELIEPGFAKKNPAQSYNSNAYGLFALLSSWGCEPQIIKSIKDDKEAIESTLKTALSGCDILVSTGGVSVGDFDFMRDFVRQSGEIIIDKVAIKPGRHIKVAKIASKMLFALPGFSYSALVTAILFIRPYISALFGSKMNFIKTAVLAHDYAQKGHLENFSAASITSQDGKLFISTENKKQGSSAISVNLLENSVLLRSSKSAKKGDIVEFIKI